MQWTIKHSPSRFYGIAVPSQVVYSQFRGLVDQGKVASARFDDSSQRVYFELRPEYLRQVKTAAGDLAWPEGASS